MLFFSTPSARGSLRVFDAQVQTEARDYQSSLEAEVEEERRQAEHQLRLLARGNEADIQEVSPCITLTRFRQMLMTNSSGRCLIALVYYRRSPGKPRAVKKEELQEQGEGTPQTGHRAKRNRENRDEKNLTPGNRKNAHERRC